MKEYIVRNEEKITQVQSSVVLLSHDLEGVEDELTESISGVNSTAARNSAQITSMLEDLVSVTEGVTSLTEDVVTLTEDVMTLTSSDQDQEIMIEDLVSSDQQQGIMIEDNIQRLDTLSTRGRWCGYQQGDWTTDNSIISYDSIFFADTNMDVSSPLDINTGSDFTNNRNHSLVNI